MLHNTSCIIHYVIFKISYTLFLLWLNLKHLSVNNATYFQVLPEPFKTNIKSDSQMKVQL